MKNELTEMSFSQQFLWIARDIENVAKIMAMYPEEPIDIMPDKLIAMKARVCRVMKDIDELKTTVENYLSHIREK